MARADALRAEAQALTEQWRRVCGQHVSAAQGCACGLGGIFLTAADFEIDIAEFLIDAATRAGKPEIGRFVEQASKLGPDWYSLSALLRALEKEAGDEGVQADLEFIVAQLHQTLDSIEGAHGGTRDK